MRRVRFTRARLLSTAGLVVAGSIVGGALAAFPDTGVETYTGCLNVGGTSGGQLSQMTTGVSPLKPCASNQKLVHLSGGDITKVTAGSGLMATPSAGDNGAVTLSLDGSHSLPQSCPSGQVPKSDGSNAWSCGNDNDTTYSAGTGLDLSSSNELSIKSAYRIPEKACTSGQFATGFDSSGNITCESRATTVGYSATTGFHPLAGTETIISKDLPAGNYVIFARVFADYSSGSSQSITTGLGNCAIPGDAAGAVLADRVHQGVIALTSTVAHQGGPITLTCTETSGDFEVLSAHLTAVKVDSLG